MKEVLEVIVRALAEHPDDVEVEEKSRRGNTVYFSVRAPSRDVGKLIGKQGRIAAAIRSVVNAAAARHDLRAMIDFDARS